MRSSCRNTQNSQFVTRPARQAGRSCAGKGYLVLGVPVPAVGLVPGRVLGSLEVPELGEVVDGELMLPDPAVPSDDGVGVLDCPVVPAPGSAVEGVLMLPGAVPEVPVPETPAGLD